jgi:hypothetical protein
VSGRIARVVTMALVLSVAIGATRVVGKSEKYRPKIDPSAFQSGIDHEYFPLIPGTTFRYTEKSGKLVVDVAVAVTRETRVVMGVTCVVVSTLVKSKGVLKEDIAEWYAQDREGNVWFFGEDAKEFHSQGRVSTEGSWEAGIDGAQPGIVMPGRAVPGEPYRHQYYKDESEDMAQIVAMNESVTVPFGSFRNCVRTREWSMLEAGSQSKWYAKGVGFIKEVSEWGDATELISVTRPGK